MIEAGVITFTPITHVRVGDHCLRVADHCLRVADHYLHVGDHCLCVKYHCLRVGDHCLRVKDKPITHSRSIIVEYLQENHVSIFDSVKYHENIL